MHAVIPHMTTILEYTGESDVCLQDASVEVMSKKKRSAICKCDRQDILTQIPKLNLASSKALWLDQAMLTSLKSQNMMYTPTSLESGR